MYANAIVTPRDEIIQQYGEIAYIPTAISDTIAAMFADENAPEPSDIAAAAISLVKQMKGIRERRTVVGASFAADAANQQVQPIQAQLMSSLELSQLEEVKME